MNRYFYYNVTMTMMINLFLFVPRILIENRFHGAVMALIVGGAIGSLLAFLFTIAIRSFPGMGLPEIVRESMPAWIWKPLLLFFALYWFVSGTSIVNIISIMIVRFFNQNIKLTFLNIFFVLICIWAATRPTRTVLFGQEIAMVLCLPLLIFILAKAYSNNMMDWDAIRTVANYVGHPPSLIALSSASIVMIGYVNFCIFNRNFKQEGKIRYRWVLPIMGYLTLATTFFVPIGFHGTIGVGDYIHVWVATTDSLRMKYGFFDRVVYLFVLTYILLSFVYVSVVWHIAAELAKGCFSSKKPNLDKVETPALSWCICCIFGLLTILYQWAVKERMEAAYANYWIHIRFWSEIVLVCFLCYVARRKRKKVKA
ncbi:GerAB/ArcD/ProY family transporter [Paenibacillus sp. OV219]|uniref:GerAB/ArcD/ProY family transporter n=1 Tax=Paenibacillus sp. OV219 TaxID=1884377 RepID=UPI0008B89485|nr:GerAB/ArcD/ProY family transporter [Paenibacillus sp. OV219]SEP18711.1 Spore germination protein [Paenibacillus sp. OV219]